jgi:hypothetical protein
LNFPKFIPVKLSLGPPRRTEVIEYKLIKTRRRLTFDILWQHPDTIFKGEDDDDYYKFIASNGYEIISRSRMDIQTERLWLLGAKEHERSGSMVFSSDEKRDQAYNEFQKAITEWFEYITGTE